MTCSEIIREIEKMFEWSDKSGDWCNVLGFLRRCPGSSFYRQPPKGSSGTEPSLCETQAMFGLSRDLKRRGSARLNVTLHGSSEAKWKEIP